MSTPREFWLVGLGRIGGSLGLQALGKGIKVVGFSRRGASAETRCVVIAGSGTTAR